MEFNNAWWLLKTLNVVFWRSQCLFHKDLILTTTKIRTSLSAVTFHTNSYFVCFSYLDYLVEGIELS